MITNEIDSMLKKMWDDYKLSPTYIFVNPDEYRALLLKEGIVYTDDEWLQFLADNANAESGF